MHKPQRRSPLERSSCMMAAISLVHCGMRYFFASWENGRLGGNVQDAIAHCCTAAGCAACGWDILPENSSRTVGFWCDVLEWTDVGAMYRHSGHTRICNRFLVKTASHPGRAKKRIFGYSPFYSSCNTRVPLVIRKILEEIHAGFWGAQHCDLTLAS